MYAAYYMFHPTSNISHTKSQNLNVSRPILQLSLPNPLKPDTKNKDVAEGVPSGWVVNNFIAYY